jgi:hypothetical protein
LFAVLALVALVFAALLGGVSWNEFANFNW